MRLLNTSSLGLESFADDSRIPPYAILSHTWEEEEVTFEDLKNNPAHHGLKGWSKVQRSAELARGEGFAYIWVDTCCIDKSSSAELSEAINSMFRWYQNSSVCYAFLCDVFHTGPPEEHMQLRDNADQHDLLSQSRWFTRGWTLQELIAPADIQFYDGAWRFLGLKSELLIALRACTHIPISVLRGQNMADMSVAQKMSWAATRQTTRPEDRAYCLMGIFHIHMPLLYGEGGRNAFVRLQEEIIKKTDDESIFAWKLPNSSSYDIDDIPFSGLLAPSPTCFLEGGDIISSSWRSGSTGIPTAITNRGFHMEAKLVPLPADTSHSIYWAVLNCTTRAWKWNDFYVILLQQLLEGEPRFIRARPDILATLGKRLVDERISIVLDHDFVNWTLPALREAVPDPSPRTIYVAMDPPSTKLHYPIRLCIHGEVHDNLHDLEIRASRVNFYGGNMQRTQTLSWPHDTHHTKMPPSYRLFQNPRTESGNVAPGPTVLAIFKLRLSISHFGIEGTVPAPETASNSSVALMVGMQDPPANPCFTPPTYRVPWYKIAVNDDEIDGIMSARSIANLMLENEQGGIRKWGSYLLLSDPRHQPVRCLRLLFQKTFRRSTWENDAKFQEGYLNPTFQLKSDFSHEVSPEGDGVGANAAE